MGNVVYDLIIQPIVYLIELAFIIGYRLTESPGIAIIGVSIAVNILCLPLYGMADEVQERERAKQKSMERWVNHIKQHFTGDERFMMLQAYYTEQGYRPVQALVGSLSLLLQIPFFVAAYSYLSNQALLRGASFLFLGDLGVPDAMFTVAGFTVNVLPIAMTLLNCVSTFIYTKDFPVRDKVQAYGLAIVFLVLLYQSPSGLVFYWTCNQVFSLIKNIITKVLDNPHKWALALVQVCVCAGVLWLVAAGKVDSSNMVALAMLVLVVELCWFMSLRKSRGLGSAPQWASMLPEGKDTVPQFFFCQLLLSVLVGIVVPLTTIGSSPSEFAGAQGSINPLTYVAHTFSVSLGLFVVWTGIYFVLSGRRARRWFALVSLCLCGVFLVDYFFYNEGLGTISNALAYDVAPVFTRKMQAANILVLAGSCALLVLLSCRLGKKLVPVLGVTTAALVALAVPSFSEVNDTVRILEQKRQEEAQDESFFDDKGNIKPLIRLSKNERNVMVLFLDRGLSGYLPYIFNEREELEGQFDGFTYYPNALCYGMHTNFASPALYGGYEYTPAAMNDRDDVPLPQKHDEALLLMPTLFSQEGFATTVLDPPYAGSYDWVTDLSIYDELENTHAYAAQGAYSDVLRKDYGLPLSDVDLNRTFVWYAAFKVAPLMLRGMIYDDGAYNMDKSAVVTRDVTVKYLSVLEYLPELTDTDSTEGGFVLLCNDTTHDPEVLQLPDYDPSADVYNGAMETMTRSTADGQSIDIDDAQLGYYHVNASALIRLGRWFDWMREQGVYDNTRIIIVADHGTELGSQFGWGMIGSFHVEAINPLLMVKDFDAHGFNTSDEFMTNADVPSLALRDVLDNPTNPFTGVSITADEKNAHDQLVVGSHNFETAKNNGSTFDTSDAPWYAVHDNIFDLSNWREVAQTEVKE